MKFTVEVGETEKIKIEFSRNWITGAMNTMGKWRDGKWRDGKWRDRRGWHSCFFPAAKQFSQFSRL
jgi:hypothetical protein